MANETGNPPEVHSGPLGSAKVKRAEEIYSIFREYIQHEDNLINQRTIWLMSVQSFLIATFGFSYQKKFEIVSNALFKLKTFPPAFCTSLVFYDIFLLSLVVIGVGTSWVAIKSVGAAVNSLNKMQEDWNDPHRADLKEVMNYCLHLPNLTGGGHKKASEEGIKFARGLPVFFLILWVVGALFLSGATYADYSYMIQSCYDVSNLIPK
jgi:hypothetical protein